MRIRSRRGAFCLLAVLTAPGPLSRAQLAPPGPIDPRVTEALRLWNDDRLATRREALRRLNRLGPRAAPAVEALLTGLADPDLELRLATIQTLMRFGTAARPAVPLLLGLLSDPDAGVREAAAWAIRFTRPDPLEVMPALVASIRARPDRRCPAAVTALASLGAPAVPVLIDLLRDDAQELRQLAVAALGEIGPGVKFSLEALLDALHCSDRDSREAVAAILGGLGPEALEPLIEALRDRDPRVRGAAAYALECMGKPARPAVPTLVENLLEGKPVEDPNPERFALPGVLAGPGVPARSVYLAALGAIGSAAVPALIEVLDQVAPPTQKMVVLTLGTMGEQAKSALPRLIALLDNRDLRFEVVGVLHAFGPMARDAIPRLCAGLQDDEVRFRIAVCETLGWIGKHRLRPTRVARTLADSLADALNDPEARVRESAALAFRELHAPAGPARSRLMALLHDPAAAVRVAALGTLSRLKAAEDRSAWLPAVLACLTDGEARVRSAAARELQPGDLGRAGVIPHLLAALRDPDANVRAAASRVLALTNGKHGLVLDDQSRVSSGEESPALAADPAASAALRTALADADPRVRTAAAYTLPVFPRDAALSVPLLSDRLKDEHELVRLAAAVALLQFGAQARPAVPNLLEALGDPDQRFDDFNVSTKAAQTLQAIGPDAATIMRDRLFTRLASPEPEVRQRARIALRVLGTSVTGRLLDCLSDPRTSRDTRVEIVRILALPTPHGPDTVPRLEPGPALEPLLRKALPAVRALTRDEDDEVRLLAQTVLLAAAPTKEAWLRQLLETVREEGPNRPDFDYETFYRDLDRSSSSGLIAGLNDPDPDVRTAAARAIAALADKLPRADVMSTDAADDAAAAQKQEEGLRLREQLGDAMVPLLNDPDTQTRWAATWALYCLGTGKKAVPALIAMARDRTSLVLPGTRIYLAWELGGGSNGRFEQEAQDLLFRVAACQALGGFRASAAPAVPALLEALDDGDPLTRWFAACALGEIGPRAAPAVPALVAMLRLTDQAARAGGMLPYAMAPPSPLAVVAARTLGKLGPAARSAIPALVEALAVPDQEVQWAAAQSLSLLGPDFGEALPAMLARLAHEDDSVGRASAMVLGRIGSAAVPGLIAALHDRRAEVHERALEALGSIGQGAAAAIPELVRLLSDPDEETRQSAAQALGQIGRGGLGTPALPALTAALKDPDVHDAALEAIDAIRGRKP